LHKREPLATLLIMPGPKPNQELLTTDKNALRFYRQYVEEHGHSPTYQQVADATELSPSGARYALQRLRDKGYLQEKPITAMRLTLSAKGKAVKL
jgi:SOS-response transcriptional repressor LexA